MTRQEEIKKGLFDVLNNCPKEKCENDDPDNCIRCDVDRVLEYLDKEGAVLNVTELQSNNRDLTGYSITKLEPLIKKETGKQDA